MFQFLSNTKSPKPKKNNQMNHNNVEMHAFISMLIVASNCNGTKQINPKWSFSISSVFKIMIMYRSHFAAVGSFVRWLVCLVWLWLCGCCSRSWLLNKWANIAIMFPSAPITNRRTKAPNHHASNSRFARSSWANILCVCLFVCLLVGSFPPNAVYIPINRRVSECAVLA